MVAEMSKESFRSMVQDAKKVGRLRCGCGARVWVNPRSTWLRDSFINEHWACGALEFETQPVTPVDYAGRGGGNNGQVH